MLLGVWWGSENWLSCWWNLYWHLKIPDQTGALTDRREKNQGFPASGTALQTMESVHGDHCLFGSWKGFSNSRRDWSNLLHIGLVCVKEGSSTYVWIYSHINKCKLCFCEKDRPLAFSACSNRLAVIYPSCAEYLYLDGMWLPRVRAMRSLSMQWHGVFCIVKFL